MQQAPGQGDLIRVALGNNSAAISTVPVQVVGAGGTGVLTGVTAIAVGLQHTLALKSDGTVWAWGNGFSGQVGNNANSQYFYFAPVQVVGAGGIGVLTGVTAIAAGGAHSLALKSDGTVWAWGGSTSIVGSFVPVQVPGAGNAGLLTGVTAIAAGGNHSLALKSDGTVWAWGRGFYGELGNNSTVDSSVPVQVVGAGGTAVLTGVTAIAGSPSNSLALKGDGTVWAWGFGFYGQLGNNSTANSSIPVQVVGTGGAGALCPRVAGGDRLLHAPSRLLLPPAATD